MSTVAFVPPTLWQAEQTQAFRSLSGESHSGGDLRIFAAEVVGLSHQRHIGITPRLAADLSRLLLLRTPPTYGVWQGVHTRLVKAYWEEQDSIPQGAHTLTFHADPFYFLWRVALPVVQMGLTQIGKCYLFAADEEDATVTANDYTRYSDELHNAINALATTNRKDEHYRWFWRERALTLASLTESGTLNEQISEVEPLQSATFFRLGQEFEINLPASQTRHLHMPTRDFRTRSQREDSVEGVYLTRDADELSSMLASELLVEDELLLDKLFNTGFLAIERQSKRQKPRDALIAAITPSIWQQSNMSAFVKACWFNAMLYIGAILRQNQRLQSEFRWIESDDWGQSRTTVYPLNRMPTKGVVFSGAVTSAVRGQFLKTLRWLPALFDSRARFQSLHTLLYHPPTTLEQAVAWVGEVWHHQQDEMPLPTRTLAAIPGIARGQKQIPIADYAYVHLLLCLPWTWREERESVSAAALTDFARATRMRNEAGIHLSVTWVPETLRLQSGWEMKARSLPGGEQTLTWEGIDGEREIALEVSKRWALMILRELQHGT